MTGTRIAVAPPQQGVNAEQLSEQIQRDVQRALDAAAQARADAARSMEQAQAQARAAGAQPGTAFRVDENGNIVPLEGSEAGEAVTEVTVQPPPARIVDMGPPPEVVAISIAFFVMLAVIIVGLPIARAFARRMDRQASAPPRLAAEQAERIARIEHAVEAVAIEVERISEGQRFVTKLLTERALPDGEGVGGVGARQADPLPVGGERR